MSTAATQRPRIEHDDWSTPLHDRAALLTLEETGNYRATCRRCRDTFPQRDCLLAPPGLYPYIVETQLKQKKSCPDEDYWFESEPGCCFKVASNAMLTAVYNDDVPGAAMLAKVRGTLTTNPQIHAMNPVVYVKSVEMVRALHHAGVDFTEHIVEIMGLPIETRLEVVAEAIDLQGIDINTRIDGGPTMLMTAVHCNSLAKVNFVLQRHPDLAITGGYPRQTALDMAGNHRQQLIQASAEGVNVANEIAENTRIIDMLTAA